MDKYDFIKRLDNALEPLSESERESAISYYKELFEDAGYENESDLIEKLGTPESIAESIIRESGMICQNEEHSKYENTEKEFFDESDFTKKTVSEEKSSNKTSIWLIILLIIVTFPLWIGVVASAFGILVAIIATVFALTIGFAIAGITCFFTGISLIFTSICGGLIVTGIGLIFIGIVMLLCVPLIKFTFKFFGWLINGIAKLFKSLFGCQRKVVA